jgi:hypothetical protein
MNKPQNSTKTERGYSYIYGNVVAEYIRIEAGNPRPYPGVRWYVEIRRDGGYIKSDHFQTLKAAEAFAADEVRKHAA